MKKEKTIKITEFRMKPKLVGAIIKYITMITAPIPRPNPIPDKIPKPKKITLADVITEMRAGFARIDARIDKLDARIDKIEVTLKEHDKKFEQIFDILKRNNLK
jgi:peptidoglycan hydrolase CwlO-like protein